MTSPLRLVVATPGAVVAVAVAVAGRRHRGQRAHASERCQRRLLGVGDGRTRGDEAPLFVKSLGVRGGLEASRGGGENKVFGRGCQRLCVRVSAIVRAGRRRNGAQGGAESVRDVARSLVGKVVASRKAHLEAGALRRDPESVRARGTEERQMPSGENGGRAG